MMAGPKLTKLSMNCIEKLREEKTKKERLEEEVLRSK